VTALSARAIDLPDEAATASLARRLARQAATGDVIGLSGELGTGKTSFARAFIRSLGRGNEDVPSPTFTLVEIYAFAGHPPIWHFDLYRLKTPEEAYELAIEDAFAEGVSLIEWPERLGPLLPQDHLRLTFAPGPRATARRAQLTIPPSWAERLREIGDE
jgi:tRNA threonylcarbamoyladenosine biosynthesis protein TsaE